MDTNTEVLINQQKMYNIFMLYSKMLGKTKKQAPADEVSKNAQLLIRAGYIYKEMAGVYAFLPLGLRVLNKIIQILREEMNAIGGQEVFLASLQNRELWEKTGRWDDKVLDVWFKTLLYNDTKLGLANTHEEPLTQVLTQYVQSYRDLPQYIFQCQNKFRNEKRSKSGLIRTREFIMKDLYSFNKTETGLDGFYEKVKEAYFKYFERIGLGNNTYLTFASGGAFSKYSHEFQTVCETGEDIIYLDRESRLAVNNEVYTDEIIAELKLNKNKLEKVKAIEVGNIFKLKTKYSEPLGLKFIDEDGSEKPVIMGCYGIGPGRSMGTVVELNNDEKGIIWPESIAPYKVHLVGLNLENTDVNQRAFTIYKQLEEIGVEVLFDDRSDVSAGQKFADADLIGCPYRLVVSAKTGGEVEVKPRSSQSTKLLTTDELLKTLSHGQQLF